MPNNNNNTQNSLMSDIDALDINTLLTTFNEYENEQKINEIRLIEDDNKNKLSLKPNLHEKYKVRLEVLKYEYQNNLKALKWIYVAYSKNPNNLEYSKEYYIIINRLGVILDNINIISIEIEQNIIYLNNISKKINTDLDYYKNENKQLVDKVNNVKSVDNTSKSIIDDYTDLYKNQRSYNIGMVITFILAFFLMRKIFYQPSSTDSTSKNTTTTKLPTPTPTNKNK